MADGVVVIKASAAVVTAVGAVAAEIVREMKSSTTMIAAVVVAATQAVVATMAAGPPTDTSKTMRTRMTTRIAQRQVYQQLCLQIHNSGSRGDQFNDRTEQQITH